MAGAVSRTVQSKQGKGLDESAGISQEGVFAEEQDPGLGGRKLARPVLALGKTSADSESDSGVSAEGVSSDELTKKNLGMI